MKKVDNPYVSPEAMPTLNSKDVYKPGCMPHVITISTTAAVVGVLELLQREGHVSSASASAIQITTCLGCIMGEAALVLGQMMKGMSKIKDDLGTVRRIAEDIAKNGDHDTETSE